MTTTRTHITILLNETRDRQGRHLGLFGYRPGADLIPAWRGHLDLKWDGINPADCLEDIFRIFNVDFPADYPAQARAAGLPGGRSLSVGDVVQVGYYRRYSVDSFGFSPIRSREAPSLRAIYKWRDDQLKAGQTRSLQDYYRFHNICFRCRGTGGAVESRDGGTVFEHGPCSRCGATGCWIEERPEFMLGPAPAWVVELTCPMGHVGFECDCEKLDPNLQVQCVHCGVYVRLFSPEDHAEGCICGPDDEDKEPSEMDRSELSSPAGSAAFAPDAEPITKIRYGVSRRKPGSRRKRDRESHNGTLLVRGVFGQGDFHQRVLAQIGHEWPGWSIDGYAEAVASQEEPQHPMIETKKEAV